MTNCPTADNCHPYVRARAHGRASSGGLSAVGQLPPDRLLALYERFKAAPKGSRERRHLRRAVEREARRRVDAREAAGRAAR
jgi:hypothetical protein